MTIEIDLPLPPVEFRHLVGPIEPTAFDDSSAHAVLRALPEEAFAFVFDYGCGCGRLARQLMRSEHALGQYVGIDPHRGMIDWCRANITARAPQFQFLHHDVYQEFMNPDGSFDQLPLPAGDGTVSLFLAWSVFTHLLQADAEFSLHELSRVLQPSGIAITTWFIFDKTRFPMMQESQNALYISDFDPTNAVIFDRQWLQRAVTAAGLRIVSETPPLVPGHQWTIRLEKARVAAR
jgi:SAM-dependent methyltransferase